ncbi:MAG: MFS transporter [Caldisphaera sp.]|jgi:MFS family permease
MLEYKKRLYITKFVRVFSSGLASILTPIYLAKLGYSSLIIGLSVFLMVIGNVISNLVLIAYGPTINIRNLLKILALLSILSGLMLSTSSYLPLILLSLAIGNISATGTEAGPYQSSETALLARISKNKENSYAIYNFLGYSAAAIGSLSTSFLSEVKINEVRLIYILFVISGSTMIILYDKMNFPGPAKGSTFSSQVHRNNALKLSALFSLDSFGGGLVTQSLLSYFFYIKFHANLSVLGPLFAAVNVVTALSILATAPIARRIGNLNTMVFTHIISSVFLIMVGLAGNFLMSSIFLLARQSMSQMDVPTRQSFMAEIFPPEDLMTANSLTNTARMLSSLPGGPIVGALMSIGLISLPIISAGSIKIIYDASIYFSFKSIKK